MSHGFWNPPMERAISWLKSLTGNSRSCNHDTVKTSLNTNGTPSLLYPLSTELTFLKTISKSTKHGFITVLSKECWSRRASGLCHFSESWIHGPVRRIKTRWYSQIKRIEKEPENPGLHGKYGIGSQPVSSNTGRRKTLQRQGQRQKSSKSYTPGSRRKSKENHSGIGWHYAREFASSWKHQENRNQTAQETWWINSSAKKKQPKNDTRYHNLFGSFVHFFYEHIINYSLFDNIKSPYQHITPSSRAPHSASLRLRNPEDLLDIIETKGREIAEALGTQSL